MATDEQQRTALAGSAFALSAYGVWGFAPLYFRWVDEFGALAIVAHRVLWSALLLAFLVWITGGVGRLRAALGDRRILGGLAVSGILIGTNWLLFIYAVVAERVLEASLGYFINPLVSLVLGMLFLGERLRPLQWLAVVVAVVGVGNEVVRFGDVPWLGLTLALSFGFYGLVRKRLGVDAFTGLTVETWLLLPPMLVAFAILGVAVIPEAPADIGRLFIAGPITMLPLLCFAAAANRLSLGAVGFFQYVAPSLHFVLAIWVFAEPFEAVQWWTFGLVWLALALFTLSALHSQRRHHQGRTNARI